MAPKQTLLAFEQATVDAQQAKQDAAAEAKADAQHQLELDKMSRRLARQWAQKQRTPDEHAQCGIRWYCRSPRERERGCYWTHCHTCGQELVYTSDPNAKPRFAPVAGPDAGPALRSPRRRPGPAGVAHPRPAPESKPSGLHPLLTSPQAGQATIPRCASAVSKYGKESALQPLSIRVIYDQAVGYSSCIRSL